MSNFNVHYLEDANFKVAISETEGVYQSLLPVDFYVRFWLRAARREIIRQ